MIRSDVQEPPFAVQIELTEGCNLYCQFCGLRGIRAKPAQGFKFIDRDLFASIISELAASPWNPRLEFAMHGEPSLHPEFIDLIRMIPKNRFYVMVTSNGGGLTDEVITAIRDHVNCIALDCYNHSRRIWEPLLERHEHLWYPTGGGTSPHTRTKGFRLVAMQDISEATEGTHSMLNNHAGAAAPPDSSMRASPCAKPFRELAIRWDGNVAICCNDWRGDYVVGNVADAGILALWQHRRFVAARKKLLHARSLEPCSGCNARSYRVGLLPDKKGQQVMTMFTAEDQLAVEEALAEGPLAERITRPWEM